MSFGEAVVNGTIAGSATVNPRPAYGIKAGCILCGELRQLMEDGTLAIVKEGNQIADTDDK